MKCTLASLFRWAAGLVFVSAFTIALADETLPPDWQTNILHIRTVGKKYPIDGTGFLMYDYRAKGDSILLITCRHMVEGQDTLIITVNLIPNPTDQKSIEIVLPLTKDSIWFAHENPLIDVAVVRFLNLRKHGFPFLNYTSYPVSLTMPSDSLIPGMPIEYLGFPLGLTGGIENTPIVRFGNISLAKSTELPPMAILIEAHVFPGNSGGPVFTAPHIKMISDSVWQDIPMLIGVVAAYKPAIREFYNDRQQIIGALPEHSGLSYVFTYEAIKEVIDRMNQQSAK